MKKITYILLAFMLFTGLQSNALAQKSNKIKIVNMKVAGVCSMCQKRIEKAAFIKGVKSVHWNKDNQVLIVIFNTMKTSADQISSSVATSGHNTEYHEADQQAYERLPDCCRYKDESVKPH